MAASILGRAVRAADWSGVVPARARASADRGRLGGVKLTGGSVIALSMA